MPFHRRISKSRIVAIILMLCHTISLAQPIFRIDNEQGEYKGILLGVFHQGIPINPNLFVLLKSLISKNANLIMEQKPVGGWSPIMAKEVFELHGISLSQVINKEKLACLQRTESQFTRISPAHASMYSSGPAAYVLMIAQPKTEKIPANFSSANVTVEQWLYGNSQFFQKKKIEFLEDHLDMFTRLKEFSSYELAKISGKYCNDYETGLIEKNGGILDLQRTIKYFENGEFDELRMYVVNLLKVVGWPEKLIKNQYESRELIFAEKISKNLKNSNEQFIITVGAAHIGGSSGLLELLRGRGFKITKCYPHDFMPCIYK